MRSPRGFAAAVILLAALPLSALYRAVTAGNPAIVMHGVLAVGVALMAAAVFDFRTARWIAWTASASLSVLAVIFLLQGVSEWAQNEALTDLAFRVLGQRLEAWAGDLFIVWCIVVLFRDSQGWTRTVGAGAIALVVGMRGYAYYLSYLGRSLNEEAPALIALALLPFVWLLLETTKRTRGARPVA
jgi:hypothetical protein